jgi:AcrR family transcriptional regulator
MRSDARRNRELIVRTVRDLLLARGPHVPMEEIAKEAGVGVGTLYRHFPERYDLLKEVAIQNMTTAVGEVEAALAEEPDGWHSLARVVRRFYEVRIGDPIPLLAPQLIDRARTDPDFQNARRDAATVLGRLLDRAKADCVIRPDLGVADLLTLATARPEPAALFGNELAERLRQRHLQLILDGLRPRNEPLPGPSITEMDIEAEIASVDPPLA